MSTIDKIGEYSPPARRFLENLKTSVSESTFQSHKSDIGIFIDWAQREGLYTITEDNVAQFVISRITETDASIKTVSGSICSLSNLIALEEGSDPELVKLEVLSHVKSRSTGIYEQVASELASYLIRQSSMRGVCPTTIEEVYAFLRQRHFGTRTHVFAELVVDTRARPEMVRQIDLSCLSLEKAIASIGIAEKSVLRQANFLISRPASLSESTVSALKWYISHERSELHSSAEPLLTTTQGRISQSQVRRTLKMRSQSAVDYESHSSTTERNSTGTDPTSVAPSDLWWYAISEGGDEL